jgi:hypothetical protein
VYSIHFYLLERLSNISIFSIIPELESCRDELLKMLVQAAYDIAGDIAMHHATSKVTDHLTTIICSVIEDMALVANGIQVELLDLMVCALCQDEKRKNQNGYALMRKVISSCPNNFQPFLERQLHQVVARLAADLRCRSAFELAELASNASAKLFSPTPFDEPEAPRARSLARCPQNVPPACACLLQRSVATSILGFGCTFACVGGSWVCEKHLVPPPTCAHSGCCGRGGVLLLASRRMVTRKICQVKTGIQLESDLTNKDRLAEAVFELSTIAPKCLTGVSSRP